MAGTGRWRKSEIGEEGRVRRREEDCRGAGEEEGFRREIQGI